MMRWVYLILLMVVTLAVTILVACSVPMNMNTVIDEPNFSGIVEEVGEKSILVKVNEDEITSGDLVSVSLDAKLKDSITDFKLGDEVRVYYDGNMAETYPAQVNKVYAIILVESFKLSKSKNLQAAEEKVINNFQGITMAVKKETLSPIGLRLMLENKSKNQAIYSEDFLLEEKVNGKWYQVAVVIDGNYGFNDIGYELNPGKKKEWEVDWHWLYGSLENGDYRIIKEVLDFRATGDFDRYYLGAEFEIN